MDRVPLCSVCVHPTEAMLRCVRCGAFYCSDRCQKWDWDNDEHHRECVPNGGAADYTHPSLVDKNKVGQVNLRGIVHGREMTSKQLRYASWVHGEDRKV